MVDRIAEFVPLIGNARVENVFHSLLQQPFHMAVGQLGRVALRFAGNGFNAQLIDFPGRGGRKHYLVAQLCEEGEPERVVLEHVQNPRNAHLAPGSFILGQRRVVEQLFIFILEQIGNVVGVLFLANSPLAAVSADILAASAEFVDGQTAAVGAALAVGHPGRIFQRIDLLYGQHGGGLSLKTLSRDQGRAEGSHDTGDVGADGFAFCNTFEAPQHGVVVEGSALDDDMLSQLRSVGDLDDLVKSVLDDRIGQSGGDVRYGSAFLLGLLYL